MTKVVLMALAAGLLLFGADLYVYRSFQRFARYKRRMRRWGLPAYRLLMVAAPVGLTLAFLSEVALPPHQVRLPQVALVVAGIYYVPKLLFVLSFLVRDFLKFVVWLFQWFQRQLLTDSASDSSLDLADMKSLRRREFLKEMGWSAASVPFVMVGYPMFRSLYDFEVHGVRVSMPALSSITLTVAQLSDLHAGSLFSPRAMDEAVNVVMSLEPDAIAITGDFVSYHAAELDAILPSLRRLDAPLGVYGCLGNHDHYADVNAIRRGLASTPVQLLVNDRRTVDLGSTHLHIVGTDNTGHGQDFADLDLALEGLDPEQLLEEPTVLLAHDPTFWDQYVRDQAPFVDLTLSGHTHGGQVGFERNRVRLGWARIAYPRWAGLYAEEHPETGYPHYLYVNRGIGTVGPPMRWGIRPEVTLLTLERAA